MGFTFVTLAALLILVALATFMALAAASHHEPAKWCGKSARCVGSACPCVC